MENSTVLVLVDLEQTLIESWEEPFLLRGRAALIRDFLAAHPEAELGLMSWAVYHDHDLATFRQRLQPDLEAFLGRCFAPRWTLHLDQWGLELGRCTRKQLSREDLFDLFGKAEVFLMLARFHPEWAGQEVVLFDDAFEACHLTVPDRGCQARIVNVLRPWNEAV